jgi:Icc-related predicted phosphoesterase
VRRSLILLAALSALALGVGLGHGLRFPPPRWDPAPLPTSVEARGVRVAAEGAYLVRDEGTRLVFRASAPEPVLQLDATDGVTAVLALQNVHPEAKAIAVGPRTPTVRREGPVRELSVALAAGDSMRVRFAFPERQTFRFAAIGDAGGEGELAHCLRRAAELGADFLLHLGDVGYTDDAFVTAERILAEAPLPIFAAIGNHDLAGPVAHMGASFTEIFGPRNTVFRLGGVTFLNVDTAADTLPPSRGARGRLLRELARQRHAEGTTDPVIVFTHRPLRDPRNPHAELGESHALNRAWESSWLRGTLKGLGATALLAGHIHESHEFDDAGLPTWVAGEGLGEADLWAGKPAARMLIGEYAPGGPVRFHWELIGFPRQVFRDRAKRLIEDYIDRKQRD